jgi:hypothetical protein
MHLSGMENLTFTYKRAQIETSVGSTDQVVSEQATPTGETSAVPIDDSSPYWMNVKRVSTDATVEPTIPLTDGYFALSVPRDFLTSGSRSFALSWVDFYR